jgi:thiamine-phosphate pyrophosphorylase
VSAELSRALALVAITDSLRDGVAGLVSRAGAAVRGGATMIQLRLKEADARTLAEVARCLVAELDVPLIVNDRLDVALVSGAAGVHLGPDDLPVTHARQIAPDRFIIGASLGSEDEAANARDANYVGIGPLYTTRTKRDAGTAIGPAGLAHLRSLVDVPCVGIGGITAANARAVIAAGATGVAVVGAIFEAEDPEAAARSLRAAIDVP